MFLLLTNLLLNGRGKLVSGQTQIRYSWYIPLTQLYTHEEVINPDFKWIIYEKALKEELKSKQAIIKNFAPIYYDRIMTYPLMNKDKQMRNQIELSFSPVYFATTKQKKVVFNFDDIQHSTNLQSKIIRSVSFVIQIYPIGFGVISAYINFNKIINPDICNHFVKKLRCGSKQTSIEKYVHYLKMILIKNLFQSQTIGEIKTDCIGPKIRINFINNQFPKEQFVNYSNKLLSTKNAETNILYKYNKKTDDQLAFHKKGLVVFTDKLQTKGRRRYFRKNLDFIMDIVYGAQVILPLIPSVITKTDSKNAYNRLTELLATVFVSLNPEILGCKNELGAILPTAGLRLWFRNLSSVNAYSNYYISHVREIISRVDQIRVDKWYEIITSLLKENIPIISEILKLNLEERNYTVRELVTPKIQLDDENTAILDFLLERLITDYLSRFGFSANTQLPKDMLGYYTLNALEKALGITGRNHLEFKNRLDLLSRVGLLETKAYRGPGSRSDSVQYRASPKHPYVDNHLRKKLINESISELKLK